MKKSIVVRAALSVAATVVTVAVNWAVAPSTALLSSNAALGQMTHSDAAYVASVAEMNIASMLAGLPGWALLVALVLIWGSLFFNKNQ